MYEAKVLIIDCFDSFTFNLLHYIQEFETSVLIIGYDDFEINKISADHKVIFSPGPGVPNDYPKLFELLTLFNAKLSILGVCLGFQIIGEYYGAVLTNLPFVCHGVSSAIIVNNKSFLFSEFPDLIEVGRYHSWAFSKHNFPNELTVTSLFEDEIVMSFEHKRLNLAGVQFHPESIMTPLGKRILFNWLKKSD